MPDSLLPAYPGAGTEGPAALEALLSRPLGRPEYVALRPSPGARLLDVHPGLRLGPALPGAAAPTADALVERLGNVATGAAEGPVLRRFVEPGVGRSCIAADLAFAPPDTPSGWPSRADFLLTGTGLTPYSTLGFVNIGRKLDGRLSLVRARHRTACARRLNEIGCRASLSVATIALAQPPIEMPDGTRSDPVILCRAFRSLVRVKQLDPLACVLHSPRHSLAALDYVLKAARPPGLPPHAQAQFDCAVAIAFDRYGPAENDVPFLLQDTGAAGVAGTVRQIRLAAIRETAPALVRRTIAALALPVAGDDAAALRAYSAWFATELGRQLGLFKKHRFLHDYHYPGIRRSAAWIYSLVENNVTLACEFADLETGVFVDADDGYLRRHLQLGPGEIDTVRRNFDALHRRDLAAAWRVAATVQAIVQLAAPGTPLAHHHDLFMDTYHRCAR